MASNASVMPVRTNTNSEHDESLLEHVWVMHRKSICPRLVNLGGQKKRKTSSMIKNKSAQQLWFCKWSSDPVHR